MKALLLQYIAIGLKYSPTLYLKFDLKKVPSSIIPTDGTISYLGII